MVPVEARTLRQVLLADGFTSGATGVALLVAPGAVARIVGVGSSLLIEGLGIGLLLFGVLLLRLARMPSRGGVLLTAGVNIAWVLGSGAVVSIAGLSAVGNTFLIIASVVVLTLAIFELRHIPPSGVAPASGTTRSASGAGVIVAILLSGAAFTRQAAGPDETAVRAVVVDMTEAWNRGDPRGVAAMFTSTGTVIAGDGTQRTGRADIEQYFADLRTRLPSGTRFLSAFTSVRFLRADVALVLSEGGFLLPGQAEVAPDRFGVQSFLVIRDGDGWRAALVQRTRILPQTPAPSQ